MKYLLVLNLIMEIILTCLIPYVKSIFFDQLALFSSLAWYGLILYISVYIFLDIIQNFKPLLITLYTNVRRKILTNAFWTKGFAIDSRSQRIQEDIKLFVYNQTLVYCEYFISGTIVFILILQNWNYKFLIAFSIIYSIICIGSALLFKSKMIKVEKDIQQIETEFRDVIREKNYIWKEISYFVDKVLGVNIKNAIIRFNYGLCVKMQTGIMTILPYIYLLPGYLSKDITLGQMMEQASIFQLLVINMIILTQLFPQWMQSKASKERLKELI